jgi:spore maturation protein CgeB
MVPISKSIAGYVRNIAESKMWFSTTSQGSLLPQRTFEVLASGRALLIMNRPDDPRITDGIIVEGEHCAMFNTTEEFIEKVIYYSTHEEERMRIVSNAHRLALAEHQWSNRGNAIRQLIENGTCFSGEVI